MSQGNEFLGAHIERTIYSTPIERMVNDMAYSAGVFAGKAVAERIFRDYDPLTNLFDRRGFTEAVSWTLRENPDKTYGLAAVDIGNLKIANTRLGHSGGDYVILLSAMAFRRKNDIAGRFGGDELVTMFELDRRPDAGSHAEQLAAELAYIKDARTPIVKAYPQLDTGAIRIFMGVGAVVYDRSMSLEDNYKIADVACEADKLSVRNIYGEMRTGE